jgi:hypothetical protein
MLFGPEGTPLYGLPGVINPHPGNDLRGELDEILKGIFG